MDDKPAVQPARALTRQERAEAVAKALAEAARRSRLSKKHRQRLGHSTGGQHYRRWLARVRRATFVMLVLLPCLAAAAYYGLVASGQYVAEARFTVRGGMPPKLDTIGALIGLPSMLIMQDTQVILNYIRGRDMVDHLDRTLDLRKLYSQPPIDVISRLRPDAPIERIVKYWDSMVDISLTMPGSIVTVKVRAFTRDDAQRIVTAVLAACENLVNDMNDRLISDTLAVSDRQRQRAEANLTTARANLEKARNTEGLLSADATAAALNGLLLTVNSQLAEMQQEYETQRRYVRDDTPQIRNLTVRIQAATEEIEKLKARLTRGPGAAGTTPLTTSISRLDYLNLENTVAEKLYASSLDLLEHARLAAESRLLYLNVFVRPALAEDAEYPRRLLDVVLFAAAALVCWYLVVHLCVVARGKLRVPAIWTEA